MNILKEVYYTDVDGMEWIIMRAEDRYLKFWTARQVGEDVSQALHPRRSKKAIISAIEGTE